MARGNRSKGPSDDNRTPEGDVGRLVHQAMESRGWNRSQLAKAITKEFNWCPHDSTLGRIERGVPGERRLDDLLVIAEVLGLNIDEINRILRRGEETAPSLPVPSADDLAQTLHVERSHVHYDVGADELPTLWHHRVIFRPRQRPVRKFTQLILYSGSRDKLVYDESYGPRLIEQTQNDANYMCFVLDLGRDVDVDEVYVLDYKIEIAGGIKPKPFVTWGVAQPMLTCERAIVEVQFDTRHQPTRVWELTHQTIAPGVPVAPLKSVDRRDDGFYQRRLNPTMLGIGEGFLWDWNDEAPSDDRLGLDDSESAPMGA